MTARARTTRLLALAACLVTAGCGSDDGEPIPAAQAQELLEQVDSIQSRFENSVAACQEITVGDDTNSARVEQILASLPQDVEARDALQQSFDRLFQLTSDQCDEQQADPEPTDTQTEPEPTNPTPTDTDQTDTDQTDTTTPTDTDSTNTGPTDTGDEPPPDTPTTDEQDDGGGAGAPGDEE